MGSWSLRLLLLVPSWALWIGTHSRAAGARSGVWKCAWAKQRKATAWEGWEVAVACPKDGKAWLTGL